MEANSVKLSVIGRTQSGRCRYDKVRKRALVEACLRPGVSVARQALENGINANLLRKWIARYLLERERTSAMVTPAERVLEQESDLPHTSVAMP